MTSHQDRLFGGALVLIIIAISIWVFALVFHEFGYTALESWGLGTGALAAFAVLSYLTGTVIDALGGGH